MVSENEDDVQLLPFGSSGVRERRFGVSFGAVHALLPDSIRNSPYTWPTLVAVVVILAVLPVRLYFGLILLGAGLGYFIAAGGSSAKSLTEAFDGHPLLSQLFSVQADVSNGYEANADSTQSRLPAAWRQFVSDAVRDIVDLWLPNVSREGGRAEFHTAARRVAMDIASSVSQMIRSRTKDTLTLLVYGAANALIVHVSEFREWQASGLSLDEFVLRGQSRRRERHFWTASDADRAQAAHSGLPVPISDAEMAYLRQVSETLLRRMLPRPETQSALVRPLLRELVAAQALLGAAERLSDPDWINMQLVARLQDPSDAAPILASGWHMITLRIIRGRFFDLDFSQSKAVAFVLHVAGRRIRTHRMQSEMQFGDEAYRFRLSERVLRAATSGFRVYMQMIAIDADTEHTVGYARLEPVFPLPRTDGVAAVHREHVWLKVVPRDAVDSAASKSPQKSTTEERFDSAPEILVQAVLSTGPSEGTSSAHNSTDASTSTDARRYTLRAIMHSHDRLMELLEAMSTAGAPPFVQFLLNVDALRGFGSVAFDDSLPLSNEDIALLRRLRREAEDVFASHFRPKGRYRVPLDNDPLIERMRLDIARSDAVDANGRFIGGPIGTAIFADVCLAVEAILVERFSSLFPLDHTTVVDSASAISDALLPSSDRGSVEIVSPACGSIGQECGADVAFCERITPDTGDEERASERRRLAAEVLLLRHKACALRHAGNVSEARAADAEADALDSSMQNSDASVCDLPRLEDSTVQVSAVPESETDIVYEIRLSQPRGESVVQRTAGDVAQLHSMLSRRFHKVTRMYAPGKTPLSVEAYLNMLVSDAVIRQAEDLRRFVDSGHEWAAATDADFAAGSNSPQSFLRSMISSTTSLLFAGVGGSDVHPPSPVYMHAAAERPVSDPSLSPRLRSPSPFQRAPHRAAHSMTDMPLAIADLGLRQPGDVQTNALITGSEQPRDDGEGSIDRGSVPAFVADFSEAEVDMLVEIAFALAAEVFDLHEPSQWLRRRLLGVFKQLLKQAYGDTLAKTLNDAVRTAASTQSSNACAEAFRKALYPEVPTASSSDNGPKRLFFATKNRLYPEEPRSDDERYATMVTARALVVRWAAGPDAPIAFESMVGRHGAVLGATRVFAALQCRSLNKTLLYILLDLVVNLLLADNPA